MLGIKDIFDDVLLLYCLKSELSQFSNLNQGALEFLACKPCCQSHRHFVENSQAIPFARFHFCLQVDPVPR